ncbi:MAG TPA: F0F1 ATP synthase subunit A [Actinomycetota bacterium]|nr:F0F1 ATP synthase subunit A [Actinomycetota bacterium]
MNAVGMATLLGIPFHPPSTEDFVFDCLFEVPGLGLCFNYIMVLLLISVVSFFVLFWVAFRRPRIVPGKFQLAVESALEFVRNQIVMQMIGPAGLPFLPFLATLFFFIFLGNILEVTPFVNFPLNSRLAFPLVMAVISWIVYNAVGVRRHGLLGYLKLVLFPPGAPWWLYPLLSPIEFFSVIVVRPITLTVRLTANMIAGHFLLAVFFLGTLVLLTGVPYVLGLVSFGLAVVLVGFEVFVSALQAFIFAVLTASYIAGAMAEEH